MVPAGAREPALAEAIFAGSSPIVRVKLTVVAPEVIVTGLSPESAAGGGPDHFP